MMSRADVAIVVGGSEQVMDDLDAARMMCHAAGLPVTLYAVNDAIAVLGDPIVAVTLHPAKLRDVNVRTMVHRGWLSQREEKGYPPPVEVWSIQHSHAAGVTKVTEDWGGSGGLYAVKVARQCGHDRIVLAGVPMTVEAKHFVRKAVWNACHAFRRGWTAHKKDIAPFVRSMSGWTAAEFGMPTEEFLQGQP
jgi:hypothetical protein